ncbi:hypothetical protein GCM10010168_17720 [Actinoplanes ianthinogenes]|uniref:HTH cro/C1-type domain-containing protein n=1 Tax=Actinoplanes ianthinogenes TaxID=122358 RepID=A0ABM7M6X4_9ACTN|nr:hypothetical protein [Actinoplanes ianthinogenes]BCJ47414.1 hypothetical protein Aiant_80710 [Actinoplanes ianthinogenes]GGR01649.1 hypothetical protein GCM10010168_17720 [Actinoplanes ianthinogenes]
MPRPERPLQGHGGPVEELAAGLRALREKAGTPGYRQMAARVNYSVATLSAAASGRRLPSLEVTLAYVAACDGDPQDWEQRWRAAARENAESAATDGPARSPYPGLAAFQPEDAPLFFGRAALVDELAGRLRRRRFLAVFGPSGVGKSSVVRAGLVPAMGLPVVVLTPGAHPMTELAVHLSRHAGISAGALLDELRADPRRARLTVRQGSGELLVVVDQFEETFATCADPAERADFITALLAMCHPDGPARVVLAVRADHYARFTEYPELLAALTDAQVLVGAMSPAELREAVTKPAEQRGARVEGALVATVVAEVADAPGALPLAAHALRETWNRRHGALLTLAGYQAAGGVAGAVAHTAERAYEQLSDRDRIVAQRVLLRMVDVGPDGLITRRPLGSAELGSIERASRVVEAFAAARLVSTDRDTVEIAHEALIRAWPRLHGWVEESRAGLRLHRQLTEAAAAWESLDRDEGALYRGLRLSATVEAVDAGAIDLAPAEGEFLAASRALRDREARQGQRRTRGLVAGLVAVLTVVSTLGVAAAVSAGRAAAERDRAVARELAAAARAERLTDPELALLLAQRAYRLHPDAETESVVRQATADTFSTVTMDAHHAPVTSLSVSGSQVASADSEGVVKLWDLRSRTPPVTVPVPGLFVDFGPDGRLAIGGVSELVLWRPGDKRPLRPDLSGSVSRLVYSSDGRWVAADGSHSQVHVWDTRAGSHRTLSYPGEIASLAVSDAGKLAVASDEGTVRIWDLGSAASPVVIHQPGETYPGSVAFSPDGRRIAVAGLEKVLVWSADGRTGPAVYRGPEPWYSSVAFSPDGRRIAAGTTERTVRIWDVSDSTPGLEMHGTVLRGHRGAVQAVAFSPDGRRLISGSDDATVRVWDITARADPATVTLGSAAGTPAVLSEDGGHAAAATAPGTISVVSTRTGRAVSTLHDAGTDLRILAVGADGQTVVTGHGEQIRWWRTKPVVFACPRRSVLTTNSAVLSGDGNVLTVNCGDGTILVEQAAGEIHGYGPVVVNRAGTLVALTQDTTDLVLWDLAAGRVVRTLKSPSRPLDHVRFSPDGRLLAAVGEDGAVRVWTLDSGADPVVLTGTAGQLTAITFSPDSRLIAGIGTDAVVRLWNTDGSGEALTLDHPTGARQIAFSPDGRLITLYGAEVRTTPCEVCGPIGEVLALAGQRTSRDFTPEERAKYLRDPG